MPRKSTTQEKKKGKKHVVEINDDDTPSVLLEPYEHGSLANGDTPPDWVARAIEDVLKGNPYRDLPNEELTALAHELHRAQEQLRLVERVLQARHSVW